MSDPRSRILDAAAAVFGRYGYRRSTMDLLAKAAGMSRPAVYQYFAGKEAVFHALGERLVGEVIAAAERARDARDLSLAERLYGVLTAKLDAVTGGFGPEARAEILGEAVEVTPALVVSFKERHTAILAEVLDGEPGLDLAAFPARNVAILLSGALTGIAQEAGEPGELRALLREHVDLIIRGLARPTT
ncbi:TetR/AcrR family transcriptional regulator [Phytomonospora endophytica]|uniref:AcrR family transcriptional regulator n=1 Tax=Phytomonospora endophytica TaxID=714109 RepID=A0A841FBV0_9ACTN|nr:TetR/AcrR family transcriptional regulator [Phytomonospora endophytica]MBB6034761.1 AcrR family transcriptional regulator [Phytomonospora endophytica]GIG69036.1 TetR family transcriptional regulator [Phytomonospora endophytica]